MDSSQIGKDSRVQERYERKQEYVWMNSERGLPLHIEAKDTSHLPLNAQFIAGKKVLMGITAGKKIIWSYVRSWFDFTKSWTNFDEISTLMNYEEHEILDHVTKKWKQDAFFGYQFLNGLNPMLIQCCKKLPDNFPVCDEILSEDWKGSLAQEMKKGNIFLCDYNLLDAIETKKIGDKKDYLVAPLVLLLKTPDDELKPIAIQLKQTPAADNPIFLPNDGDDWLLAKIFVRSAEFHLHQLNFHLLRTHLLAEVFAVSLLRNLPMVHPLYKLLIPHTRYTLHINVLARNKLISTDGVFPQISASGENGMLQILRRSLSSLTYKSLCIHDDIKERGMENIPNFYYRDDGCRLWDILQSYVEGILNLYYKDDQEVKNDTELQKWIREIYANGFLQQQSSGIPQRFNTVSELVKFVTMVIFTGSVQHSAVNSGQFDFGGWMPNLPSTMRCPPPTKKGNVTEDTIMAALPDKVTTRKTMDTLLLLTRKYSDFLCFGKYPEEHFTEKEPLKLIEKFQEDLTKLSEDIKDRNKKLPIPYTYLDPEKVENSVAI
ncbi:polyunsaturated fatty acid lipoxygenase ALOX15B-like [Fundulus heteroclitus]|uniref:polyunsaturated fatty acid lipoxygenase ALOX15B-like n=1 Tax=Fundulus heteroclitus TaxID=8078 RepID=UPI00165BB140|nr:polyunsaturated fatty acid lipoxygenase ALOX15B-like [Fundulus heteroclitus]